MKSLKTLGGVIVLTLALVITVLAGATQAPPCVDPAPGQTDTPPCASTTVTSATDSAATGRTHAAPAASSVDVVYIAEAALHALLSF